VKFNELTPDMKKELYNVYTYSYGWKYCITPAGFTCKIGIEEYYKLFGLNEFVLNKKTKQYIVEEDDN
jgi:hypothetical protein